jgi:hypothetical protein
MKSVPASRAARGTAEWCPEKSCGQLGGEVEERVKVLTFCVWGEEDDYGYEALSTLLSSNERCGTHIPSC